MITEQIDMRCKIKHNFLHQIIYKIDYEGVLDSDVDKFIQENREVFKREGFFKLQEGTNSVFDVQIQEGGENSTSNVSVYPRERGKVFHIQSNDGRFIEFSKSAFVILINTAADYDKIDKHFGFIKYVVEKMKSCYSFPEVTRIGLRKINLLYVKNVDKINEIFTESAFNIDNINKDIIGCVCKNSNESSLLVKNDNYVNYVRNFQEGELNGERAYQLVLDIDVFQHKNDNIKSIINNPKEFETFMLYQNNILFDVFVSSLQDSFKEKLMMDVFSDNDVWGVK